MIITKIKAGKILLNRLFKKKKISKLFDLFWFSKIWVIKKPERTKKISTPMKPELKKDIFEWYNITATIEINLKPFKSFLKFCFW